MTSLDLRPLSLGEILDRTFFLYRSHFLLFIGIAGIPQLIVFAFQLVQITLQPLNPGNIAAFGSLGSVLLTIVAAVVGIIAYLISQAATVLAVSDLYLGRQVLLAPALQRARGHLGFLFGVICLNGLAIMGGLILLIIPGIYFACRLLVCVPAALIEERSPRESISRSWNLTRGFAGRAFMICLLFFVIAIAAATLFTFPFTLAALSALKDPATLRLWTALVDAGNRIGSILTEPILLIATAIFYYDLRVRKEAFDLQFMMDPNAAPPAGPGSVPSIL
jgi:hypothetical protein